MSRNSTVFLGGYNHDAGKSNRAVRAEESGLYLAGSIAKMIGCGATAAHVEQVLEPDEWHHVGGAYQRRNYFLAPSLEECEQIKALARSDRRKEADRFIAGVEWLEWPAFKSYGRRQSAPTHRKLIDATVTIKGQFATIEHDDLARPLRKKLTTKGFDLFRKEEAGR